MCVQDGVRKTPIHLSTWQRSTHDVERNNERDEDWYYQQRQHCEEHKQQQLRWLRAMVWPHTNTPMTPRSTARVHRHMSMISHRQYLDVSTTLRTGCSLTDSNLILGRRNCCGARPVVARTDFQPPHWQSAHRLSPRCPRYVTWASSSTPTWWCAHTCVRRCRAALLHCVSCAASFSRLLLL